VLAAGHVGSIAFYFLVPVPGALAPANGMAESFVDSFKTELIADRVWRTRSQLDLAIVEYVAWFDTSRLHESLGDLPPAEFESPGTLHSASCSS
jgi:transposase InsO family protein